jgi:hypothetical protein
MCLAFFACELNAKRYSTGTREISFGWKEIELGGIPHWKTMKE